MSVKFGEETGTPPIHTTVEPFTRRSPVLVGRANGSRSSVRFETQAAQRSLSMTFHFLARSENRAVKEEMKRKVPNRERIASLIMGKASKWERSSL